MRVMNARVGSMRSRSTSDTSLLATELVGEICVHSCWLVIFIAVIVAVSVLLINC
jgi:hypothetical protein